MAGSHKRRPPREWDDDDDDRDDDRPARRKETNGGGAVGTGVMLLAGLLVVLVGGVAAVAAAGYFLFAAKASPPIAAPAPAPVVNAPAPVVQPMGWDPAPGNRVKNRALPRLDPAANPGVGGEPEVVGPAAGAAVRDAANPPPFAANPNSVIEQHRAKIRVKSGRSWGGQWSPAAAFDRNEQTSWFPTPDPGGVPAWVSAEFPEDVAVQRVSALGNREPNWGGYRVRKVRVELFSAAAKVLSTSEVTAVGPRGDSDVVLPAPVAGVRTVRVTLLETEPGGGALAEFQVD